MTAYPRGVSPRSIARPSREPRRFPPLSEMSEREWAVEFSDGLITPCGSLATALRYAESAPGAYVVCRARLPWTRYYKPDTI